MKTQITRLVSLLLFMAMISCSKDDDTSNVHRSDPENFLLGYLEATGFSQAVVLEINTGIFFEFGLDFTPLVNGRITALKVMLPRAHQNLRITIWDKTTSNILKTEFVNIPTADTEFNFDITDIELPVGSEYAITMNTDSGYFRSKTNTSSTSYPIVVGNIQINGYKEKLGANQAYPTGFINNFYYGDLSFDFMPTE